VEIHELVVHASLARAVVFVINVAVVVYLVVRLRQTEERVPAEALG
jgi:uncharacterized membrane protein (DUF2068 family)